MFAGNAAASYPGSDPVLLNLNTDNAYTFDNLCFRNMSLCRIVTLFLFFFLSISNDMLHVRVVMFICSLAITNLDTKGVQDQVGTHFCILLLLCHTVHCSHTFHT